jgi:hypothetical protein
MEEIPKYMVRVEMAEQTEHLVTLLEQAVRRIQVKAVKEEQQLPSSHQTLEVSSLWVEKAVPDWWSFNIPHNSLLTLPPRMTMATVSSWTVFLGLESLLGPTTLLVRILGSCQLVACGGVIIMPTELLATGPAPRAPASLAHMKHILIIQTTGKNISTRIIFQRPSPTPGTLLRIRRHSLVFGWENLYELGGVLRTWPPS